MKGFLIFAGVFCFFWCVTELVIKRSPVSFMDNNHSNLLKGYAISAVLVCHVGQYCGVDGIEFPSGVGVTIFLICSGYGIQKSFEKSGCSGYWGKRFARVWMPYIIAECIWGILIGSKRNPIEWILDLSLILPRHPFGWYLQLLFVCYVAFYLVNRFCKEYQIVVLTTVFLVWFLIKSTIWIDPTPFMCPRQSFAFVIGVIIAKKQIGGGYNDLEECALHHSRDGIVWDMPYIVSQC